MDNSHKTEVTHLPALRVEGADAALDWAWLFDFGQGDFAAARDAADAALAGRRDADTLRARAVVHQLQGEFDAALALLEESYALTPDAGRRFMLSALATLVERKRDDTLPDGVAVNFTEAIQRHGPSGGETGWTRRHEEARLLMPGQQELLAGGYVYFVLSSVMGWRSLLRHGDAQTRAGQLNEFTNQLSQRAQEAQAAGEGRMLRALYALHAGLASAAGQAPGAAQTLDSLAQWSRDAGDAAAVAWCSLQRGDILAAPPPLGHPALFGYAVQERTSRASGPAEPGLFDRSGIDHAGARAAYEEARRLYAEVGARRGVGLSALRLAYLDALDESRGPAHAARGYAEAQAVFEGVGDRTGAWLARAGQLWARLGAGEAGLAAAARPLAEEMREAGALTWGLSLGLALAGAGREALAVRGDVETAVRASRVAEVFFEVFDAPLKRAQACNDRAEAWDTVEASESALLEYEAALGWLERAAQQPQPDPYAIRQLGMQQVSGLVGHYTGRDADGLEGVLARARGLAEGVPRVSGEEIARLHQAVYGPPAGAEGRTEAAAPAEPDMNAVRELYQKFQFYTIHKILSQIEGQVSVYAPQSRGLAALLEGDEGRAAPFFEEALRAAEAQPERDHIRAQVFAVLRRPEEARAALERYIADGTPGFSVDESVGADPALQRRLHAGVRRQVAGLFSGLEMWDEARRQLEEVGRLEGGPPRLSEPVPTIEEIRLLAEYGLVAEGLGEAGRALDYLSQAVEGMETRRRYLRQEQARRAFGGQGWNLRLYGDYARLLAAQGETERAFAVAEMTRARVLAESLGGARAASEQLRAGEAYRRYTEQAAAVERLTTQLAAARRAEPRDAAYAEALARQFAEAAAELDARELALGRESPQWRELAAPRPDVLSVARVAERLPAGTLMLAYLYFSKYLLSWAVTRDGLVGYESVVELDGRPLRPGALASRARAWVRAVGGRGASGGDTSEAALSEALLGPYEEELARAEHLLIVPFAELNTLPFQALPWRGQPLGLQKPLSYLPAASLLQYFRPSDEGARGALVVGDPDAMSYADAATGRVEALDPLPAARLEAEAVAALHGAGPLVGGQATEQNVRAALAAAPRLIHFATHGFLQEGAPLASGVALAGGEAITADELMGLDIRADVVVFSACDTGRGSLQGSELIGLARGLLYAGARAAVVSLWPVDDVATAMLMEFFHVELHSGQPPARALWRAQQRLQQTAAEQAAPYFERAAGAYAAAVETLASAGRAEAAGRFRAELRRLRLRARHARASTARRPFEAAGHWAAFQVIGDWS